MGLITKPGQRWDEVSIEAYGSPLYVNQIIAANIDEVRDMIYSGDIVTRAVDLVIPDLSTFVTTASELPPWRR
jgi:hypothetical protein